MKKTAYIIGMITAAAMLAGCGARTKTDNQTASAVRPKEAQTESRTRAESEHANESETAAAPSAENDTGSTAAPAAAGDTGSTVTPSAENDTGSTADDLITEDEAKKIALEDAKVDEADLSGLRIKLERDDGAYEYEVDFYVGNLEYDYDIDAVTGRIVSMDRDIENDFQATDQSSGQIISEDEAKQTALAKVPQATEQDVRIHLDRDDGRQIYEGSIYVNGMEYEFEIDAASGVILEWEEDD